MPIVPAGSTNLAAAGIPNVLVQITPPNPLLNGVPTNIIGAVGLASWGPVNSPVSLGTMQGEVLQFGNPLPQQYDLGTQIYNAIQQGANSFMAVRVTDGTDTKASSSLLDVLSVTGLTLTSLYTGALPNGGNLNAVISAGSGNTAVAPAAPNAYKLSIYFNGGVPEVFDNITGSGSALWSNMANAVNLGQSQIRGPSQICSASTSYSVSSVTVTQAGSYLTQPTFGTSGPGSGATFTSTMKAIADVFAAPGSGYAINDTITLAGGTFSSAAVLTVSALQLVSVAVNAGGTGYALGDIITLAGGTSSQAATVTVTAETGGVISGVSISSGGVYTATASSFTQGSTSGSGTGATFNTAAWGVAKATVSTAGSYTVLPTNPVSQGSTSGSGTGATFTINWGINTIAVSAGGSGYANSSAFVVSGGNGSGGAGTLVLNSAAVSTPALASYTFSGGTNGNSGVSDATLIGQDTPYTGSNGITYPRTGMYALRKTGASICVLADQTNPTYWTNQNAFGLQEGMYMIGVMANGNQDNISNAISLKQSGAVASYAFKLMMGDWDYINDPFNNVQRLVSPQGFVAGILATNLPSGSSLNKIMNGLYATQKSSEQRVYADADLLQLQTNGIDVVTNQLPVAPTQNVFGVRLGVNTSPSITTNGDNYTRMVNFLALTFNTGLGLFIGQPQTPDLQAQAAATLQSFLQNLVTLGMIGTVDGSPAFRVTLNSTNNPPNMVAQGFMRADVEVVLFSIVQRFVVNLQAGQSVQIEVLPAQLGNQLSI